MRIACILAAGYEDSEFQKPYDEFKVAGNETVVIGAEAGQELAGKRGESRTKANRGIDEVRPDQFGALFIPGGHSPDQLRADQRFVDFVKTFFKDAKPVLAICHGPQLFITADEYRNHRMTAWKTIQGDLKRVGADVVDAEVVVDRNLVTARQPSDIPAFVRESLKVLEAAPVSRR
jgi:protease I